MTKQEEAKQFVKKAPPLSQAERDSINALFPAYLFRRSKTNEIWTSCCHRHETLLEKTRSKAELDVLVEPHQREPKYRWQDYPKAAVRCPLCGREVIVKELRYTGKRDNLSRYRRAVVLRWYRGALWAGAYDCSKHYNDGHSLTGYPNCNLVGVYRFKPGWAMGASRYFWEHPFNSVEYQTGPLTKGRWNIHGPFHANAEYGVGYNVIGLDEIQHSPFRYCMAEEAEKKYTKFLEFLTACCFYPRQIEMLMKAGMSDVVRDLVERGVKHAAVIDWEEESPARVFGLNRQDLKAFLSTSRDIRTVELYKRLKGRVPIAECADWVLYGVNIPKTFQQAKKWSLAPEKLLRYLLGSVGCAQYGGLSSLDAALRYWEDYLTAAEALGYPLHRENVLLPKRLSSAHDSAAAKHQEKLEQERKQEQAERTRLMEMAYQDRRMELEKKYGFAADGYIIKVPAGTSDILDEGRKLKHCVGGYAERHIEGKLTILFMRKAGKPDTPWLTIEMHGNKLVQIHGYKNEGVHTSQGRFAPNPREVYREFLDLWLDWLKSGSPRDKQWNPKLPKKRKGVVA